MKNWEALRALTEGKPVRHTRWSSSECMTALGQVGEMYILREEDGWEIYEPGQDWAWACKELVAGRAVMQKCWHDGQRIAILHNSIDRRVTCMNACYLFVLNEKHMLATDWVSAEVQS